MKRKSGKVIRRKKYPHYTGKLYIIIDGVEHYFGKTEDITLIKGWK